MSKMAFDAGRRLPLLAAHSRVVRTGSKSVSLHNTITGNMVLNGGFDVIPAISPATTFLIDGEPISTPISFPYWPRALTGFPAVEAAEMGSSGFVLSTGTETTIRNNMNDSFYGARVVVLDSLSGPNRVGQSYHVRDVDIYSGSLTAMRIYTAPAITGSWGTHTVKFWLPGVPLRLAAGWHLVGENDLFAGAPNPPLIRPRLLTPSSEDFTSPAPNTTQTFWTILATQEDWRRVNALPRRTQELFVPANTGSFILFARLGRLRASANPAVSARHLYPLTGSLSFYMRSSVITAPTVYTFTFGEAVGTAPADYATAGGGQIWTQGFSCGPDHRSKPFFYEDQALFDPNGETGIAFLIPDNTQNVTYWFDDVSVVPGPSALPFVPQYHAILSTTDDSLWPERETYLEYNIPTTEEVSELSPYFGAAFLEFHRDTAFGRLPESGSTVASSSGTNLTGNITRSLVNRIGGWSVFVDSGPAAGQSRVVTNHGYTSKGVAFITLASAFTPDLSSANIHLRANHNLQQLFSLGEVDSTGDIVLFLEAFLKEVGTAIGTDTSLYIIYRDNVFESAPISIASDDTDRLALGWAVEDLVQVTDFTIRVAINGAYVIQGEVSNLDFGFTPVGNRTPRLVLGGRWSEGALVTQASNKSGFSTVNTNITVDEFLGLYRENIMDPGILVGWTSVDAPFRDTTSPLQKEVFDGPTGVLTVGKFSVDQEGLSFGSTAGGNQRWNSVKNREDRVTWGSLQQANLPSLMPPLTFTQGYIRSGDAVFTGGSVQKIISLGITLPVTDYVVLACVVDATANTIITAPTVFKTSSQFQMNLQGNPGTLTVCWIVVAVDKSFTDTYAIEAGTLVGSLPFFSEDKDTQFAVVGHPQTLATTWCVRSVSASAFGFELAENPAGALIGWHKRSFSSGYAGSFITSSLTGTVLFRVAPPSAMAYSIALTVFSGAGLWTLSRITARRQDGFDFALEGSSGGTYTLYWIMEPHT